MNATISVVIVRQNKVKYSVCYSTSLDLTPMTTKSINVKWM